MIQSVPEAPAPRPLPAARSSLAVTISGKCPPSTVARAKQAARGWRIPFIERKPKAPLTPLFEAFADALLVFGVDELVLWDRAGSLRFSPGMARLRIKRLDAGIDDDLLVRLAGFETGSSVLDCTLGLGADALVAARAVGPLGRVVGLEKSLALYALSSTGLEAHEVGSRSCRIEVLHRDAGDFLAEARPGTFDYILFDPMFERPRRSSPSFETMRRFADHAPLTATMLRDAARVAQRAVLVKGSRYSHTLRRLGLAAEPSSRSASVVWAKLVGQASSSVCPEPTCPARPPDATTRPAPPRPEE